MLAKKQIKLTPKKITNWLTVIIVFLTMIILIIVFIFLYKNFYQTINQTNEILILREKVALDTVNIEQFNIIFDKLTKKIAPKELGNIISPFR
ncbi:hypothetical protein A3H09_03750 [Candidatus Falkowbacteria bacterium RIFCSPLOWO2_12_FULL_45_13]|uniref:Uncharacterized protein n=2 Tax=Candidatus Falkowiibacteriota TaxID=1752728 RepID=A0A1F5SAY5_9BACT|nr:MAG: hypothetical protein A3H66_01240 [Candidatus Falkowbacteria bacterium RIFCSPLOWO2_02_FULL_45_21]OGF30453.1 MAG: hypothetical protein A3H09_03750 [Candidatus Falkowbacteria bacterium RIFCSPLOWO2_12_FULL_45_13]